MKQAIVSALASLEARLMSAHLFSLGTQAQKLKELAAK